jgi:hypothetical protein
MIQAFGFARKIKNKGKKKKKAYQDTQFEDLIPTSYYIYINTVDCRNKNSKNKKIKKNIEMSLI